jgi:hypothetical protein
VVGCDRIRWSDKAGICKATIADMVHKLDGVEVTINESCAGCCECMPFFVEAISVDNGREFIDEKMYREMDGAF